MQNVPKVLFVCTFRGGRARVADALARKHSHGVFESDCACFDPGEFNKDFAPTVAACGISIEDGPPPSVFELFKNGASYEYVVCMCTEGSREMCDLFRMNIDRIFTDSIEHFHWDIADFSDLFESGENLQKRVRERCADIEKQVVELTAYLDAKKRA